MHVYEANQELFSQEARTAFDDSIDCLKRHMFSAGGLEKNFTDFNDALAPKQIVNFSLSISGSESVCA